jgi:hypothetical protein
MSNVLDRIMALINKRLAIFVLRCGFALFLALDQMIGEYYFLTYLILTDHGGMLKFRRVAFSNIYFFISL